MSFDPASRRMARPGAARRRLLQRVPLLLLALPVASCLVPTFDLQPEDGGPDGGFGGDSSGGTGPGSGGENSDSGGTLGGGGTSSGGADGSGSGSGTGGSSSGGESSGGADTGGADSGGTGGGANSGGSSSGGMNGGGSGGAEPDVDENGKPNAVPGSILSTAGDYLRMGDFRLVNDASGSVELGCGTPGSSVYIDNDPSIRWFFNRGDCDAADTLQYPDFPHVEFGMHPFGDDLTTTRDFSSTPFLPRQISDIASLSVDIQDLTATFESAGSWTTELTFWLTQTNPEGASNPGIYAQISTYFGWQAGRWPADGPGQNGAEDGGDVGGPDYVDAGTETYLLWVQQDTWADGWRYYQFRLSTGSVANFTGTVDVKELLDYLVEIRGYPTDLWLSQIQIGSEIDDNTSGEVTVGDLSFEVNGQEVSPQFN